MLHHAGGWCCWWEGNCFKPGKDGIVDIIPYWLFSLSVSMNGLQSNVKHSTSLNSFVIMFACSSLTSSQWSNWYLVLLNFFSTSSKRFFSSSEVIKSWWIFMSRDSFSFHCSSHLGEKSSSNKFEHVPVRLLKKWPKWGNLLGITSFRLVSPAINAIYRQLHINIFLRWTQTIFFAPELNKKTLVIFL